MNARTDEPAADAEAAPAESAPEPEKSPEELLEEQMGLEALRQKLQKNHSG
jgi:hypothetical protein